MKDVIYRQTAISALEKIVPYSICDDSDRGETTPQIRYRRTK